MHSGKLPWSFRMLVGVAVGLIGLGVMAIAATVWALRADATKNALQNAGNIATILSDQTAHAVKVLDAKLQGNRVKRFVTRG